MTVQLIELTVLMVLLVSRSVKSRGIKTNS
jgi:hypothetical protein